ncbi:S-adenosylmethionine sensor upstream of mTORC1 [Plodia interpunctella]|uniref:S-adenosylmethionine sensor upstream of mTORC1 n=1 Tax=Plodia interpunctella TaxID=58824 RepID=UPI002367A24E|nr:S-adenosylmethionine sensor upstream of mTORC1 [Plodia interpunctella]
MASEEHKLLAEFLKEVHSSLRKSSLQYGAEEAWRKHCQNKDVLAKYAQCMQKLATKHWDVNYANDVTATSRISWATQMCCDYFFNKTYLKYRQKEIEIAEKLDISLSEQELFTTPLELIDVGSCYNPFRIYDFFKVFAIDLCPSNDSVLQCDFLQVPVGNTNIIKDNKAIQLKYNFFDVVTFCFLLEYLPSSEFRIRACEKAYDILKAGGLLIINTPDSKHVGANCKIMKCWRYTLACIGFTRIKYEKLKHMHCMAFRKAMNKDTAVRWATLCKEPYMTYSLNIPQDFQRDKDDKLLLAEEVEPSPDDFTELPFSI